jgi:hypothetical protein
MIFLMTAVKHSNFFSCNSFPSSSHFLYSSDIQFIFVYLIKQHLSALGIGIVRSMIQFSNPLIVFLSLLNRSVWLLLFQIS